MALLEEIPSEYIGGAEFKMSPTNFFHYNATSNLSDIINRQIDRSKYKLTADVRLETKDGATVYPDIAVYEKPFTVTEKGTIKGTPCFVAEVVSPSTREKDFTTKKDLYERLGAEHYWIVDPYGKYIMAYNLNPISLTYSEMKVYQYDEEAEQAPVSLTIGRCDIKLDTAELFQQN